MSYFSDYNNGLRSEEICKANLERLTQTTLVKEKGRYSPFDFADMNKTIYVELKTRNVAVNKYETTLLPASKLNYCNDKTKKYIFAFFFTDGLYYIEYSTELFDTFEKKEFCRFQRYGINDKPQLYIYIPASKLLKCDF